MKYDRAYLEDLMNNKPYGAGKIFLKKKGTTSKLYKYVVRPYTHAYQDPITIEVVSSDKKAYEDARKQFQKLYPDLKYDGCEWRKSSL